MIRKGTKFNDIYNYKNSKYFIQAVEMARMLYSINDLIIIAGACQSYYDGLILAGANFASSPARILIDFKDPLVIANRIAITSENEFVNIRDVERELRDGQRGISGVGGYGKRKILQVCNENVTQM